MYSTIEFGGRPDREQLKPMKDFISDMNTFDPRGGGFDQADFQEAMLVAICACELGPHLQAASITACKPQEDFLELVAVRLRVMLSHARVSHAAPEKVKKQILKIYWEFNLSFV